MTAAQAQKYIIEQLGISEGHPALQKVKNVLEHLSQDNHYTKKLREKGREMRQSQKKYFRMRGQTPEKQNQLMFCQEQERDFDQWLELEPEKALGEQKKLFT